MGAAWSEEGVFKLTFPFPGREEALRALEPEPDWIEDKRGFEKLVKKVKGYFEGRRISFEDIPVSFELGTEFQKKVWSITREIPYGEEDLQGDRLHAGNSRRMQGRGASPQAKSPLPPRPLPPGGGDGGKACGVLRRARAQKEAPRSRSRKLPLVISPLTSGPASLSIALHQIRR